MTISIYRIPYGLHISHINIPIDIPFISDVPYRSPISISDHILSLWPLHDGLHSAGADDDAAAEYECVMGVCVRSRVHFAQSPPSPPPPAGVRSAGL